MALSKEVLADKIEVITGKDSNGNSVTSVQVRNNTAVLEDGVVISNSNHRHVIHSGDDWSSEPSNVQAICNAAFS